VTKSDSISFDLEMRVGEDWVGGSKRDRTPVICPATGAIIAEVPVATDEDAKVALEAAARAQPEWGRRSPPEHAAFLYRVGQELGLNLNFISTFISSAAGAIHNAILSMTGLR
jgi:acyl-CoA reductase-like NAD-dependent aldehyde dehydrogenase